MQHTQHHQSHFSSSRGAAPLPTSRGLVSRSIPRRPHGSVHLRSSKPKFVVCAVAEAAREEKAEAEPVQQGTWYAVVANANFMLHDVQNESFAEQLRERRRLFKEKNTPLDFWLVSEPTWLEKQFPEEAKRVGRPCVALVSTDKIWMNFMKLRLDRVLRVDLGDKTLAEVLESGGPVPEQAYEPLDRKGKWTAPYPPYRPGCSTIYIFSVPQLGLPSQGQRQRVSLATTVPLTAVATYSWPYRARMSTAEPLSECNAPEHSQQSSGVLNFILSKLGRPSRNGSKSAASGKSGSTATSKQASDGLAMAEQAGDANQDGEEVQSLPKPEVAVVPDTFDFEGRRGRHGSAGVVPQSANGGSAGPQGRGAPLTHALPVGDRSASDTAQWDFRRREARRNSRSAREWVRESNVQAPASDWSKDLTKYDPDAQPAEAAAATGNMQLVPTHFEEGGMRFRRRSKSAKEFGSSARESAGGDHQPRTRTSLEATGSQHGSKRSSFEAGLHQDLKATGSPRVSAEKIPRHANAGSTSDFLPTELIQRSRLFNTRANQPRE